MTGTPPAEPQGPAGRPPGTDAPHVCRCIFNHAITDEQRAHAVEHIRYARRIGDEHGLLIHLIRLLGDCPARRTT
ncbi:hypothetical protein [Actinomadura litoris]|uniref:hypothetical protein n=1 Tax=Actinomadura litoris TaxID=2678616 RepID=UPI001FA6C863|nr:hypothetical protein [Actinomadura litoris]